MSGYNPVDWWLNIGDGDLTLNHRPCGDAIRLAIDPRWHLLYTSGVSLAELIDDAALHTCPDDK